MPQSLETNSVSGDPEQLQSGREAKAKEDLALPAREQQDDRGEQQRDVEFDRGAPGRAVPAQAGMQIERLQEQEIGDELPGRSAPAPKGCESSANDPSARRNTSLANSIPTNSTSTVDMQRPQPRKPHHKEAEAVGPVVEALP